MKFLITSSSIRTVNVLHMKWNGETCDAKFSWRNSRKFHSRRWKVNDVTTRSCRNTRSVRLFLLPTQRGKVVHVWWRPSDWNVVFIIYWKIINSVWIIMDNRGFIFTRLFPIIITKTPRVILSCSKSIDTVRNHVGNQRNLNPNVAITARLVSLTAPPLVRRDSTDT